MSVEIIIPIAAVIILWLLFTWSIKVFKASIKTLLIILAIFFLVQIFFDIDSQQIIQEVIRMINYIEQLILGK
jgi:Mn2+/Fe2+ NRAMP family transporter